MARVLALVPDLLFGSKVTALLAAAGHDVELVSGETEVWDQIGGTDVLVVDLTTDSLDGIGLLDTLKTGGEMHGVRSLAFYSHVEADVRKRALDAGFDQVVPRSRMAREGGALVTHLAGSA
ncbi:MAG TPA: response regulator [Solirubrobacteraceae bacterium]|jgi:CheY-like chemotaxis protein